MPEPPTAARSAANRSAVQDRLALTAAVKTAAQECGFSLVGVADAVTPPGYERFLDWLERGFAGEMQYLDRRRDAYAHPAGVLPAVRSVIMLGVNYFSRSDAASQEHREPTIAARVSRYALPAADYHSTIRAKLKQFGQRLRTLSPGCVTRGVVDTAPLLERDFARMAGLGWFGKNTLLLNKQQGSFVFLAGMLTDLALEPDQPHTATHCGTCTRCLEACPTSAFVEPSVLDARRCISYLTIELKGSIPAELREGVGNWLFGCDVCQEVCPWNRKAPETHDDAFQPQEKLKHLNVLQVLSSTATEFEQQFHGTALARPGHTGLRRNAAIVIGNSGDLRAVGSLTIALQDEDPVLRGSAAWALGQLNCEESRLALQQRRACENDSTVAAEIDAALFRQQPEQKSDGPRP